MPRDSSTLHVGSPAPDFTLRTVEKEAFRLRDAGGPLALIFIRGTW
jgi:peroxiredoxin